MQGVAVPLLKPGDKAGRYELLLQIAQGGMGAVWVARLKLDNGFEKLFAVKTLLTHLADQDVFRQMFLDEARIAASIEHPNVGQILDMGEQGDLLYLVMEWVEGESVNALARGAAIENKKMPYGVMLRMLSDACAGLHSVHEHRDREGRPLEIVHRDVSPHNMLVSARGVTKVIDFGVAKARDRLTGATQAGAVKGKLRYMAPEQACGRGVDRRSDVWGIGAVLYTLVAGRYPYGGETDVDVLREMMSGRPPAPLPPSVPGPIERVLRRALDVDPEQRYQNTADLAEDLDAAARELGVLTSQHGVAAYVEENAGARLSKLRSAIHMAIEAREALNKGNSSPGVEGTVSSTLVDPLPPIEQNSQSGTLMGTTAFDALTAPIRRLSLPQRAAAAGTVLAALILLLVGRATNDRSTIPSASAAAPAAEGIPPAAADESPGIDLDHAAAPVAPATPQNAPPPVIAAPPPPASPPVPPPVPPAVAIPVAPAPPPVTPPVVANADPDLLPPPPAPPAPPKRAEVTDPPSRSTPPVVKPGAPSTGGASKKRTIDTAIESRR